MFTETPNETNNPYEFIGRQISNKHGYTETAVMRSIFWNYLDWLERVGALDLQSVLEALDCERGKRPLGEALEIYLYEGSQYRKENNLPQPPWLRD